MIEYNADVEPFFKNNIRDPARIFLHNEMGIRPHANEISATRRYIPLDNKSDRCAPLYLLILHHLKHH